MDEKPNNNKIVNERQIERPIERPLSLNSHPIFKKLSKINGNINNMTIDELRQQLNQISLEDSGSIDSCKKRLKKHYKNEVMNKLKNNITYNYDIICIVDFEAICDIEKRQQLVQEIIEFPALMIDVKLKQIVSTFHEFVKPKSSDKLTEFCINLTGISQSVVDNSKQFPEILDKFEIWFHDFLKKNNINSFALATDGSWDLTHFLAQSCKIYSIPYPSYAKRWINIRKVFCSHYKTQQLTLDQMLTYLGMQFKGRKHSGYDDAINIANILIRMIIDGANPVINERISWHQSDRNRWLNMRCGFVRVFNNKLSDGLNVSDSDDSITEAINEELNKEKQIKSSEKT